ncbi:elongation factor 1-beta [Candidatus Aciduliprofundum boonei]|uniref:Elongation factor 1-beta n=1 Tax=Aciduliprofundum boonei (strain DSM 19572 / T469) TaxID=439481 RepID=B5IGX6_ACIB4|nr:elongation factor 1-beta [Candidatus Aciduliprofundum boonei]ADD08701.1 translation elongation factor aEF-1 beta [Aciduliprofundum boonei T469]EDY34438.1 translation elongation factor aEF-1 beta [Aciduliprofundum boonei T469]EDY34461.1 translation elongation factor aEF-1 beta [Aciduliprofundum boonei T469]HII54884.1 elongation factor 1-beta [Candidatus Aciduliprofundum boonei]
MGDVLVTYKIMPEGVDVDFEKMKEEVKKKVGTLGKIAEFDLQPIAFGLKALVVKVIVKDEGGIADKIEEEFNKIENVQGVVIEEVTLI